MSASWLLPLLLGASPGCAPPEPAAVPDPDTAQAYLRVAREEEATGHPEAARLAVAQALRLDPQNAEARTAHQRLCLPPKDALLDEAVTHLEAGDCAAALPLLAARRAQGDSAEADLLEGICHFEADALDHAVPLLERAAKDPELTRSAELFLGLVALRRGFGTEARAHLVAAGLDDDLLALTTRSGRLIVSAELAGGWDSNVSLAPTTRLLPSASDDVGLSGGLSALVRPLGENGPFVLGRATYRMLSGLAAWDLGSAWGEAGWSLHAPNVRGHLAWEVETVALGMQPHLTAHGPSAAVLLSPGSVLLTAAWSGRMETLHAPSLEAWSGFRQTGQAGVAWSFRNGALVGAGWELSRDLAQVESLSYLEHGPALRGFLPVRRNLRLSLQLEARLRVHDEVDPDFEVLRSDRTLSASGAAEWDVSPAWSLFLRVDGGQVSSRIPGLSYTRVAALTGIRFVRGVW